MPDSKWKLFFRGSANTPPLLIKHAFSNSDYTIYITDLTYIWSESLPRKAIIKRALEIDTSIDPSEDSDQLKLLLRTIQSVLDGEAETTYKLERSENEKAKALKLALFAKLPAPFQPLEWVIHLLPSPQSSLARELLYPNLQAVSRYRVETQYLVKLIKEKDHVITRLVDKLQASGIELSTVFPSAGPVKGSKGAIREMLIRSVPGLAEFDETSRSQPSVYLNITEDEELFKLGNADEPSSQIAAVFGVEEWWEGVDIIKEADNNDRTVGNEEPKDTPPPQRDSSNDDFQRQVTPGEDVTEKHVEIPKSHQRMSSTDGSEDDLDTPVESQPRKILASAISTPQKKKLGVLGGRKPAIPPSSRANSKKLTAPSSLHEPLPESCQITPAKPKPKIGKIGGLKSQNTNNATSTGEHGSRPSRKATTPPEEPRETSQERADQNREKLKRELEAKKAAPVKKKRKF